MITDDLTIFYDDDGASVPTPAEWVTALQTEDDAWMAALWLDDDIERPDILRAIDEALFLAEVQADDPWPITILRANIQVTLEELGAR